MTPKELENDMKKYCNGSSFIRIGELAKYLNQKNTSRVRERYTQDAFRIEGSSTYFIPDIVKNIIKAGLVLLLTTSLTTLKADANEIDFEANGFQLMNVTAYCVGEVTADGSPVHEGGCACSLDHIGDVAVIYTTNGNFLGFYECNDTGAAGGAVRKGTVVDVYRCNYTRCSMFMKVTEGKAYIRWISGKG